MGGEALGIQDYLVSYVPGLVGRFLEEKPIPDMQGTLFTLQVTIRGEKDLVFGISIKDAREITVHPGGLESPMLSVTVSEEVMRHIAREAARFVGRKHYDGASEAKGTLQVEMEMPGGWTLPLTLTFNGAEQPQAVLKGQAEVMSRVMAGQLTGPEAFMQGKVKFEGDIVFLMSLAKFL
jgi:hypothetical protein